MAFGVRLRSDPIVPIILCMNIYRWSLSAFESNRNLKRKSFGDRDASQPKRNVYIHEPFGGIGKNII